MARDAKLVVIFFVFVVIWTFVPVLAYLIISYKFDVPSEMELQIDITAYALIGYLLVTQAIQFVFLRTAKMDEPVFDLVMSWGMGNMWDDPDYYFPPRISRFYRPWRIIFHVGAVLLIVGLFVFNVIELAA